MAGRDSKHQHTFGGIGPPSPHKCEILYDSIITEQTNSTTLCVSFLYFISNPLVAVLSILPLAPYSLELIRSGWLGLQVVDQRSSTRCLSLWNWCLFSDLRGTGLSHRSPQSLTRRDPPEACTMSVILLFDLTSHWRRWRPSPFLFSSCCPFIQ